MTRTAENQQHDRQATRVRQLPGEVHDHRADQDDPGHEQGERLDRLFVADAAPPGCGNRSPR